MAKNLSELIADAAAADNMEFAGPDGAKFTLADFRAFNGQIEASKRAYESEKQKAERIAQEAEGMLNSFKAAMEEHQKSITPKQEPKGSDWRKNPLYDELVPVIEALEGTAKAARAEAEGLRKNLDQSQAIYALERMRRQWAEASIKPKDVKFEDAVQQAIASKELDEFGLPTLSKYLYRTGEPDRIAAAKAEAVAEARKEWEKTQRAASIPKPGMTRTRVEPGKAPIKNFSELTSELVANDPDIVAANEGPIQ